MVPTRVETRSDDETRAFGAALGRVGRTGDVWLLLGSFGVGKTTLVQGIAQGLSVTDVVTSPSYVIASEYRGRIPLYHLDLYRVETMDGTTLEAVAEYFGSDGICVVEWPASLPLDLVTDAARIALTVTGETTRAIALESGPERLQNLFATWDPSRTRTGAI